VPCRTLSCDFAVHIKRFTIYKIINSGKYQTAFEKLLIVSSIKPSISSVPVLFLVDEIKVTGSDSQILSISLS
jgi:hypothetical protein